MNASKFDLITGRHHSGRSRHAMYMALDKLKLEENKNATILLCGGYEIRYMKDELKGYGVKAEFDHAIRSSNLNNKFIYVIFGDEMTFSSNEVVHAMQALCDETVVVTLPALLGAKNELKLTDVNRMYFNAAPVGSRIHMTTHLPVDGSFKERCKIEQIGITYPFPI